MRILNILKFLFVSLVIILVTSFGGCDNKVVYQSKFVIGSTDNRIQILDFGGKGQPLLFLSGLGNSAHVFKEFAPKFCDKFHVLAITRRGFGSSELTKNGYNIDTLTKDIYAVIESLQLNKVILIGHSIAGEEISRLASTYPNKIDKIIYLDAAYDRTHLLKYLSIHWPVSPLPKAKDSSSIDNFKLFTKNTLGVQLPDEEIVNTNIFSIKGKFEKAVTSDQILGQIMSDVEQPNYKGINCPAMAIYAIPHSVYSIIPYYDSLDLENKKKANSFFAKYMTYSKEQLRLFKKEVKRGTVKVIKGAHHYVFISNPVETCNLIGEFLR
jgi:non-heme chloroperoxidase